MQTVSLLRIRQRVASNSVPMTCYCSRGFSFSRFIPSCKCWRNIVNQCTVTSFSFFLHTFHLSSYHSKLCRTQYDLLTCPSYTLNKQINFMFMLLCIVIEFFLNNQRDAPIIQIYSIIKLCMFRAPSLPIIRSFLLYIRHW